MIDRKMIQAARGLLGWSQQELADKAIVSVSALGRLETGAVDPRSSTVVAVRDALEKAGIEFVVQGDAMGVILRSRKGRRVPTARTNSKYEK
jgi:predicted transcriptional regulator